MGYLLFIVQFIDKEMGCLELCFFDLFWVIKKFIECLFMYYSNGCVVIVNVGWLWDKWMFYGDGILGFLMFRNWLVDIDILEDFELVQVLYGSLNVIKDEGLFDG